MSELQHSAHIAFPSCYLISMYEYYESKKSFHQILTECCLEHNLSDLLQSILHWYFENYASCNIKAVLAEFISAVPNLECFYFSLHQWGATSFHTRQLRYNFVSCLKTKKWSTGHLLVLTFLNTHDLNPSLNKNITNQGIK